MTSTFFTLMAVKEDAMARVILGILSVLLASVGALAQSPGDSWDNLKQLQGGQKIEVVDVNLKSLRGEFVSVTDGGISLRTDKGETAVERENVMRVSVKGQGHRLRNILLGTLIGGAGGTLIAASNTRSWIEWQEATAVAVGLGGGAAVGAALPTGGWKVVYRRR